MKPVLIYMRPLDVSTGQRVDVRIADGSSADIYGTAALLWQPALTERPTLSIELMSMEMDGSVQAGKVNFEISLRNLRRLPNAELLYWRGAPIIIYSSGVIEGPTAVPDFWGYVTAGVPDRDTGKLPITAEVSTAFLETDLLTLSFSGGGGLDGDPTKRGVLRPAGYGAVPNIEPVWFDLTRYIGQIDGYGNTLAINWLGEGLSSFGAPIGDYADYAGLAAAIDNHTIKPGQWGTCIAQGLVGLGAPPVGVITVHATFGANRLGAIMKRMLLTHAKVPAARVDSAAFDAFDQLVPRNVHYWTAEQVSVKDRLEAMAASANATPLVTFQNAVTVTRAVATTPTATLDRSGQVRPRVKGWQAADVQPPFAQLKARTARPALVLSFDQVNFGNEIADRGLYHDDTVYRNGNIVWLSNGSQWLYINGSPGAGHRPPVAPQTVDDYWQQMQPPTTAADIIYADGTPIENLKPSQLGADVTGKNKSADSAALNGRQGQAILQDIDTNAANYIYSALRQDDYQRVMEARTYKDGQDITTTFLQFRNEQRTATGAVNSLLSLIGAANSQGTGFVMNLDTVQVGGGKTLSQKFSEVGADNGTLKVNVQQLMEAVINPDGTGYGKFVMRATSNGSIVGISGLAGGGTSNLSFVAQNFYFADPNGGNPINILQYESSTGRWLMSADLYVRKLVANIVQADNIVGSAVSQSNFVITSSDVSIARGQTVNVCRISFNKDTGDAPLRIIFFGNFWSGDDLQFQGAFVLDGSVSYPAGTVNVVLDSQNSAGKMPMTPFIVLQNVAAGPHTIDFSCTNNETDNIALVVKSQSLLEVVELKKGAR